MKTIIFFFLAFCLAEVGAQAGLLTEVQLQEAVDKNQCSTLASRLDSLEFSSERMKLNAAICLYRNGQEQQALSYLKALSNNKVNSGEELHFGLQRFMLPGNRIV